MFIQTMILFYIKILTMCFYLMGEHYDKKTLHDDKTIKARHED